METVKKGLSGVVQSTLSPILQKKPESEANLQQEFDFKAPSEGAEITTQNKEKSDKNPTQPKKLGSTDLPRPQLIVQSSNQRTISREDSSVSKRTSLFSEESSLDWKSDLSSIRSSLSSDIISDMDKRFSDLASNRSLLFSDGLSNRSSLISSATTNKNTQRTNMSSIKTSQFSNVSSKTLRSSSTTSVSDFDSDFFKPPRLKSMQQAFKDWDSNNFHSFKLETPGAFKIPPMRRFIGPMESMFTFHEDKVEKGADSQLITSQTRTSQSSHVSITGDQQTVKGQVIITSNSTLGKRLSTNFDKSPFEKLLLHFEGPLYQHFFLDEDIIPFHKRPSPPPALNSVRLSCEKVSPEKVLPEESETRKEDKELCELESKEVETKSSQHGVNILNEIVQPTIASRKLWSQMQQVLSSGLLEKLGSEERVLNETKFEVITSEVSYYRSLIILETHFAYNLGKILSKGEYNYIFGLVEKVRKTSECVVKSLTECFEKSVLMAELPRVLYDLAGEHFDIFTKYCKNRPLIDRTLVQLRKNNSFSKALAELEEAEVCEGLKLPSFLILPVQRFLRMPLLVDAVLSKTPQGSKEQELWKKLYEYLKQLAVNCNEECGRLEDMAKRYEVLQESVTSLRFPSSIPVLALLSSGRQLIKETVFSHLNRRLGSEKRNVKLILYTDYLVLAKPSDKGNKVLTYSETNNVSAVKLKTNGVASLHIAIHSNYKKEKELWILGYEHLEGGEDISDEWVHFFPRKCEDKAEGWAPNAEGSYRSEPSDDEYSEAGEAPSHVVQVLYQYDPGMGDELALKPGDKISVRSCCDDGWSYGERLSDGQVGWFPTNFTSSSPPSLAGSTN